MNILLISPSWVGDSVMMQVLVQRLRVHHPDAHLTVMAPAWSLGLLARMPGVNATLENPFGHGALRLHDRRQLGHSLRGRFDRCYVLPNSFKSALLPWFADIAERIGYVGELRYGLLTEARRLDKKALPLMVQRFAQLAEPAHAPLPSPMPQPRLNSTREQQLAVVQRLHLQGGRPALALCPGAEFGPSKRWPARHFAAVARRALQQDWQVWLLGSAKDAPIAQEIAAAAPGAHNLCGQTSLADVIDLLAAARHVVSNDSGLMHVAAAVGTPLVAVYGSSSPGFTPPLSDTAVIEQLSLSCSPCFKRECPLGHGNCMNELAPARILQHLPL